MEGSGLTVGLIGFGEAGQQFGRGLKSAGLRVRAYDVRHDDAALIDAASRIGIDLSGSPAGFEEAQLVCSLVTASSAVDAARAAAPHLRPGQRYIDFNSVSPLTKRAVGDAIGPSGADFIEAAIMAPVAEPGYRVPVLLSGPHAEQTAMQLNALGMKTEVAGERIGDASLSKMLRSIFIKGIDALMLEGLVAARLAGIEERILDSVQTSFPGIDWRALASYNFERTVAHGKRRAAEMDESAATVAELGLDPFIAEGIARRIAWAHEHLKDARWSKGKPETYQEVLDILEAALRKGKKQDASK